MGGWSYLTNQHWDKTAALWVQLRMDAAVGPTRPHMTAPFTGKGIDGRSSGGPLWRKLIYATAVVGRVGGLIHVVRGALPSPPVRTKYWSPSWARLFAQFGATTLVRCCWGGAQRVV